MEKDELIRRLIWLQLKDTIASYEDAEELNAGFEQRERGPRATSGSVRLFINLGSKDGLNPGALIKLLTESSDIDGTMIERVTVRDLSSFFNVPASAAQYLLEVMPQKKFKGRKIRVDEADRSQQGGGEGGGGGSRGGSGGGKPFNRKPGGDRDDRGGDRGERRSFGGGGDDRRSFGEKKKGYGEGNDRPGSHFNKRK